MMVLVFTRGGKGPVGRPRPATLENETAPDREKRFILIVLHLHVLLVHYRGYNIYKLTFGNL